MKDSKKKILIVDDDPLVASLYRGKLEKDGYLVEVATDGQQGFYRIHEFKPDAVLLDLMLPQISGVDIIRKLRAQRAFQGLPILVFSNVFVTSLVNDAIQAGATKVFNKAEASPLQVLNCVRELLFPGLAASAGAVATSAAPSAPKEATQFTPKNAGSGTAFLRRETPAAGGGGGGGTIAPGSSSPPSGGSGSGNTLFFKNTLARAHVPGAPASGLPRPPAVPPVESSPPLPFSSEPPAPIMPSAPRVSPPTGLPPTPVGAPATRSGNDSGIPIPMPVPMSMPSVPEKTIATPLTLGASSGPGVGSPSPTAGVSGADSDEFQATLREAFFEEGPSTISQLRKLILQLTKADGEAARLEALQALYRRIHGVTGNSGVAGLLVTSQICAVLEAFLKELEQKPANFNASTMRTIAQAVDFLGVLFQRRDLDVGHDQRQPCALVVDDEVISRRAVVFALNKAKVTPVDMSDPYAALEKATTTRFDLIYLDVDMPGMNGFELCGKIRATIQNKTTPVVFVTSLSDFESKARSTLSGGNDLIAKPFMFIELALKSLTYIMKARVASIGAGARAHIIQR